MQLITSKEQAVYPEDFELTPEELAKTARYERGLLRFFDFFVGLIVGIAVTVIALDV